MDYRQMKLDKAKGKTATNYENIPEQRGANVPLIQPGDFLLELPKNIELAWAEPFNTNVGDEQVERVAVQFDPEHPLVIVAAPVLVREADPSIIGQMVRVRVANNERNRARRGDPPALVSDMHYLLFEGLDFSGKPEENLDWILAMNQQAGKRFVAALTWSSYCSEKKTRYIDDGQGGSTEDPDKTKGCGSRYYQSQLARDESGFYLERFVCSGQIQIEGGTTECGAALRCFPNLERFRLESFAEGWN